ncbi:hypothetical protein, partial [Salmonella enterica]|uniref:hypothetical protein n=1 Tax=Salmonella enterica TaxID=28901 RepID=UPI0022B7525D
SGFFMHTTRLWAMAHLTCYHCHITCVVVSPIRIPTGGHTPELLAQLRGSLLMRPLSTEYF